VSASVFDMGHCHRTRGLSVSLAILVHAREFRMFLEMLSRQMKVASAQSGSAKSAALIILISFLHCCCRSKSSASTELNALR
jgi:hypothetical protein